MEIEKKVDLKTHDDKIKRILEISQYLISKMFEARKKGIPYQPNTGDEDQPLREEAHRLRIEVGIMDKDGKLIKDPSDQVPVKN